MKISQYAKAGDSKSLTSIDGKSFTIVKIEDSDYDDNGQVTPGLKITTKETFDIEGEKFNKFHTTRIAIVNKLKDKQIRDDLLGGKTIGPVMCEMTKAIRGGKPYFDLVDA